MGSRDYSRDLGSALMNGQTLDLPPAGSADFRQAMSRIVGAVHIITTTGSHGDAGITATAVCSVSDAPPTVLVCLNKKSRAHDLIVESGILAINSLGGNQEELANAFAGVGGLTMQERFQTGSSWGRLLSGAPVLESSVVSLDCRVAGSHLIGTHRVFYCAVIAISGPHANTSLIYADRRYGTHKFAQGEPVRST